MFDTGKVIAGLVVFLVLIGLPLWYGLWSDRSSEIPQLELAAGLTDASGQVLPSMHCVRDSVYMRSNHMDLLNEWRDEVVRDGRRVETAPDGRRFVMSLQNTCVRCHHNKAAFCDRCHDYMSVSPYCWQCHVEPAAAQPKEGQL
jgi:hypothetical protein